MPLITLKYKTIFPDEITIWDSLEILEEGKYIYYFYRSSMACDVPQPGEEHTSVEGEIDPNTFEEIKDILNQEDFLSTTKEGNEVTSLPHQKTQLSGYDMLVNGKMSFFEERTNDQGMKTIEAPEIVKKVISLLLKSVVPSLVD